MALRIDDVRIRFAGISGLFFASVYILGCFTFPTEAFKAQMNRIVIAMDNDAKSNFLLLLAVVGERPIEFKIFGIWRIDFHFLFNIFAISVSYAIVMLQYELEM